MGRLDAAISHRSKAPTVPENLAERMGIEPDRSRHPIFQVAFSFGNESVASKQLDLHLQLAGNSLTLYYNQALFETSTVRRMLGHLQELLSGEVKDCNCPIAQLPMLSDRELHAMRARDAKAAGKAMDEYLTTVHSGMDLDDLAAVPAGPRRAAR